MLFRSGHKLFAVGVGKMPPFAFDGVETAFAHHAGHVFNIGCLFLRPGFAGACGFLGKRMHGGGEFKHKAGRIINQRNIYRTAAVVVGSGGGRIRDPVLVLNDFKKPPLCGERAVGIVNLKRIAIGFEALDRKSTRLNSSHAR